MLVLAWVLVELPQQNKGKHKAEQQKNPMHRDCQK